MGLLSLAGGRMAGAEPGGSRSVGQRCIVLMGLLSLAGRRMSGAEPDRKVGSPPPPPAGGGIAQFGAVPAVGSDRTQPAVRPAVRWDCSVNMWGGDGRLYCIAL